MKTAKYFTASWCGPCKMFKPIIKEIEREGYSIQFIDIDYDENDLAGNYGVQALPTTIIVEGSKEVERFVGALSKKEVLDKLV